MKYRISCEWLRESVFNVFGLYIAESDIISVSHLAVPLL